MLGKRLLLFSLFFTFSLSCDPTPGKTVPPVISEPQSSEPIPSAPSYESRRRNRSSFEPTEYIPWSCADKPNCFDRFKWSLDIDLAYHVWRGDRDLVILLQNEQYLKGGDKEVTELNTSELTAIINKMKTVNSKGNRLMFRIETEKHRFYDPNPFGLWHRSQVRKDVAQKMRSELRSLTAAYTEIAADFWFDSPVPNCDSLRCWLRKKLEEE